MSRMFLTPKLAFNKPTREGFSKDTSTTLHGSATNPGVLSYVLLFQDAHPCWAQDGIIFVKSNLDLLPAEVYGGLVSSSRNDSNRAENLKASVTPTEASGNALIAIFTQIGCGKVSSSMAGIVSREWSCYNHIRMNLKYFREGLKKLWAVVKFEKDMQPNNERGAPNVSKLSVIDMLKLLRLGDEKSKKETSTTAKDAQDRLKATRDMLKEAEDILKAEQDMLKDTQGMVEDIGQVFKNNVSDRFEAVQAS
ncbi:uncharacterized protein A1O9_01791 [Exophiala aquamarina CBS 119918]|uniref:Uncharacterized protein n=1 Tax=Exophiala aquamarina CBS 119918 TaxID=1182545 RepID=A0A072PWT3_9EURO|nr:uncharacterized protein A1O9_01791 [Exophiala aquamarina CBS 119918]KEF63813.1 hypothetical protein A1O9_01791 [Exophiala aquamarina CBS 119918]